MGTGTPTNRERCRLSFSFLAFTLLIAIHVVLADHLIILPVNMHTASLCNKGRSLIVNGHDCVGRATRRLVLVSYIVALLRRSQQMRITEFAIVIGALAVRVHVIGCLVTSVLDVS